MLQLRPWGASEVGGVQPRWPGVMGWVQVTRWCHLRKERGPRKTVPGLPGGMAPQPLHLALTWPGRQGADFSDVRRLLGMSD